MMYNILLILLCTAMATSAWSIPYHPAHRAPMRFTRFAPLPIQHRVPIETTEPKWQRPKRGHDDYHDHDHDHDRGTGGVTGPVHTFVKTDKNANYKWGVRHHVGDKYAS